MMSRIWWAVRNFFLPQQRWLTRVIPKEWTDKPELIEDILFECIIHFWEAERGGEKLLANITNTDNDGIASDEYLTTMRAAYDDLKAAYEWALARHDAFARIVPSDDAAVSIFHGDFDGYQQWLEFDTNERRHLMKIVEHYRFLWT